MQNGRVNIEDLKTLERNELPKIPRPQKKDIEKIIIVKGRYLERNRHLGGIGVEDRLYIRIVEWGRIADVQKEGAIIARDKNPISGVS